MRQLGADGVKADGALLLALALAPEYCRGAPDICRRPRNIRSTKMPAKTTSPSSSIVPNPSDNPRCDINAASPSPAAMPAIGPSQRVPDGAGAGVAAGGALGALAEAGAAGCDVGGDDGEAALLAGAAGAGAAFCGEMLRCAPKLPPPPMRLASAMPFRASVSTARAAKVKIWVRFIGYLRCLHRNMALTANRSRPSIPLSSSGHSR